MKNNKLIKNDIVSKVYQNTRIPVNLIEKVIDGTLDAITEALSLGNEVTFMGFGTFEPKQRAARVGRNPHTGEAVPIPARVIPMFRAGKSLKDAVTNDPLSSFLGEFSN